MMLIVIIMMVVMITIMIIKLVVQRLAVIANDNNYTILHLYLCETRDQGPMVEICCAKKI